MTKTKKTKTGKTPFFHLVATSTGLAVTTLALATTGLAVTTLTSRPGNSRTVANTVNLGDVINTNLLFLAVDTNYNFTESAARIHRVATVILTFNSLLNLSNSTSTCEFDHIAYFRGIVTARGILLHRVYFIRRNPRQYVAPENGFVRSLLERRGDGEL